MMRIAFTGVSHWHLPLYLDPVLEMRDVSVVGVEDPDMEVARAVAGRTNSGAWNDWKRMIEALAPDFVFVLGRHCDMAAVAEYLIERAIPFCIEKPCGLNYAEVRHLAALAQARKAFAAVPFVFRQSRMMETLREKSRGGGPSHLSFKFIAGSTQRYVDAGCSWMLDRRMSGGGSTLNLGVHFFDLARILLGPELRVAGGVMSTINPGQTTEDYGTVLLDGENGSCVIETGYLYPAPHMTFDMHFSIRTRDHYFAAKDGIGLDVIDQNKTAGFLEMPMTNPPYYPVFVKDVLRRVREGQGPLADLSDMAEVLRLVEEAYAAAPLAVRAGAAPAPVEQV